MNSCAISNVYCLANALPPVEGSTGLNGNYWSRLDTNGDAESSPHEKNSGRKEKTRELRSESHSESDLESNSESNSESPSESGSDDEEQDSIVHRDRCNVCDRRGDLLCCDSCPLVYHLHCLNPPLKYVPEGEWRCEVCRAETSIVLPRDLVNQSIAEAESQRENGGTKEKDSTGNGKEDIGADAEQNEIDAMDIDEEPDKKDDSHQNGNNDEHKDEGDEKADNAESPPVQRRQRRDWSSFPQRR